MNESTCIGPECERKAYYVKRGLCKAHETQRRRHGELKPLKVVTIGCIYNGCDRGHKALGYCEGHYAQILRGDELHELVDPRRIKNPYGARRTPAAIKQRDEHGRKQCKNCREWLQVDRFTKCKPNADGLSAACKGCVKASGLIARYRKYGLTPESYEAMFNAQGRACAACRAKQPGDRGWHIDHDHSCCPKGQRCCGQCVRGILCRACNLAIGMAKDDPATLRNLATYVERYNESR